MTTTPRSRYRWVVFGLLALGYFLVFFHRLCPAVVALDLMEDLHAGGWILGLLASMYFYPYALMQIPSGLLSDSWGPRKTVTTFFLLAGAASLAFGMADSVAFALGARLLVGVGVAMLFVPTIKILTCWFPVSQFAFTTGLFMAVGGLGGLTAATPLAWLAEMVGWRGSFLVVGAATLLTAGGIWIFVRDTPEEMNLPSPNPLPPSGEANDDEPMPLMQGVKRVLGTARFWPLAAWFFSTMFIYFSFSGLWGGPFLMEVYGMDRAQAGGVLSLNALALVLGSPFLSWLSDRLRSRKVVLVGASLATLLLTLPLVLAPAAMGVGTLYAWSFLFGLSTMPMVSVGFTAAKELFPMKIAGTSVGLVNVFPFMGGAVGQVALGLVLDAQGRGPDGYSAAAYGNAFWLFTAMAVLALAGSVLCQETFPRAKADAAQPPMQARTPAADSRPS